ncbi:hypothetical protein HZB08_00555 [Candidatus Saganbacteria bacterium]|uniref:Succinate dehydrogenase n=1 Tax=Candidatus Saganbacteria bacterium TaxID=2575572 RepID=A0A9D6YVQ9_UNCSA|nr:hypothetical protein [Candidatus Saganbacteria bacterium]
MHYQDKAFWLWFFQRVSAVLIFAALALHILNVHYAELGKPILFAGVALRLKNILILSGDSFLLFLGLFHGLNGLRAVLLDYDFFSRYDRTISRLLIIVGLIFFIWGVRGLWAFIAIR